ncbi:MAG TPA: metallophosphoesterase, partial [Candidatus Methanoperedens sp.]
SIFEYKQKPVLAFVSASDLHYGYANDTESSGFTISRFISDINNQVFFPSPNFVAIVGDAADTYNHIADSKALYDTLNVPYYMTMGNHEMYLNETNLEPLGYRGQTFYNYYGKIYNYTVTKDGYTFIFGGVTGDYPPLTNYLGRQFGDTNFSLWLDRTLAENEYKPAIAFSHFSAQAPRDDPDAQYLWEDEPYGSVTRGVFEKYNNMPVEFSANAHIVSKNVTNNITYIIDGAIINQPYIFDYVEIYADRIQVHTIPYRLDTDNSMQFEGFFFDTYTDSTHTLANYSIGNPDEKEVTIVLVNITSEKLTNLWNFTANNVQSDKITLGNNNIISNNILVNLSAYEVRNIINMTVSTSSDSVAMNITAFNTTSVAFNESAPNSTVQVSYTIGDRIPNKTYSVEIFWINGTKYQDFNVMANDTGYISYSSTGFGSSRYQEINITNEKEGLSINIPPSPINITSTMGNFWINTTWQPGTGNVTDGYNVSVNGVWTNDTSNYSNISLSAHAWQNVTVYAFNASGNGSLSIEGISKNTQIQNNPPEQYPIGNRDVDEGQWLNLTVSATDADNDTVTYGTNATRGSFNSSTGEFS